MAKKKKSRFRIFAGPNGSGKSELFKHLKESNLIKTEIYVSADKIEKDLLRNQKFVFNAYRVKTSASELFDFIENHGLWVELNLKKVSDLLSYEAGIINVKKKRMNSYVASFIANYLVLKLFDSGQSFCYETVLSHPSKIELFEKAKKAGYKSYLYFIFTENVELNVERIKIRVKEGGHNVPENKIRERFDRSLHLLKSCLIKSEIAYLINNTNNSFVISAYKNVDKLNWLSEKCKDFLIKFL